MRQAMFGLVSLFLVGTSLGGPLETPPDKQALIGKPVAIQVEPSPVYLDGPRSNQQMLVTGHYADGTQRDLTSVCEWRAVDERILNVSSGGYLSGRGDGMTFLEIRAAHHTARVAVTIKNSLRTVPISFRREVMPVLSSAGCSDIRCHGAPSGKNGFRLSLWGADPALDFQQLTRDADGRRTNSLNPDQSLILLKALARIPHVGQRRFRRGTRYARIIRDWQSQGLADDPDAPRLSGIVIRPPLRVLRAPARSQQLSVLATFDDGRTVDVTRVTTFSTTDLAVATVDRTGMVKFKRQGEVAILCRFLGAMESIRLMHIAAPAAGYRWPAPPENNYVDRHVFAKLKMLNISPSKICGDATFVRRVYLDLCGILPTPSEVEEFISSSATDKRARLIDDLIQRPEFSDYWTKKWLDVLRVSRDSIQLAGSQTYHRWLRGQIANDASMAEVVRTLLTSQGQSYRDPAVNFYCVTPTPKKVTDPIYLQKDLAEATAQLFLGIRLQCAQCHNHPYERWTQDDYLSLAAFFTQVKRSRLGKAGPSGRPDRRQYAVALNLKSPTVVNAADGRPIVPHFPGQPPLNMPQTVDRRAALADWLTSKDNRFFARAVVNRIWFHLHGRGIVEPVDDFRDSNPSANDPLLQALATDFINKGFRIKPLIRAIANSRTYQLSAVPNASNRNERRYFSHMAARPLPAEVLLDAICDVTGVPEKFEITKDYIVGIPKGKVKIPLGTRAVQLPVNDIVTLINTSGRYVRYESHPFLRAFGQPNRTQTCECDREQKFSRKQALELIVGPMVNAKLTSPQNRLVDIMSSRADAERILDELYLRAVSRKPSEQARRALLKHVASASDKLQAWQDILWTLMNSQEFIYQH